MQWDGHFSFSTGGKELKLDDSLLPPSQSVNIQFLGILSGPDKRYLSTGVRMSYQFRTLITIVVPSLEVQGTVTDVADLR